MAKTKVKTTAQINAEIAQVEQDISVAKAGKAAIEQTLANSWGKDVSKEQQRYTALDGQIRAGDLKLKQLQGELEKARISDLLVEYETLAQRYVGERDAAERLRVEYREAEANASRVKTLKVNAERIAAVSFTDLGHLERRIRGLGGDEQVYALKVELGVK